MYKYHNFGKDFEIIDLQNDLYIPEIYNTNI